MNELLNRFKKAVKMYCKEGGHESFSFYWQNTRKPLTGAKRAALEKACFAHLDDWLES